MHCAQSCSRHLQIHITTVRLSEEECLMQPSDSLFRCFSFVGCQLRDSLATTLRSVCPFVTLSRQTGSGAHHIGAELAYLLNQEQAIPTMGRTWQLYDRDLVRQVVEHHHLNSQVTRYMPEDTVNEFNSTLEELLGLHPSSNELVRDTALTIRELAQRGYCILIGRGSHCLTRSFPHGVHIRLIGSLENRSRRVSMEHHISREAALRLIKQQDRARARYLDYYYGHSIDDASSYDLVINTDLIDTRSAVSLISTLICQRIASIR